MTKEELDIITATQKALQENYSRMGNIPFMILKIIEEDKWRVREFDQLPRKEFSYFSDFIQADLPYGLRTEWKVIQYLIKPYPKIELAVAKALTMESGSSGHIDSSLVDPEIPRVKKTDKQQYLQRLERDRPDLLEKVNEGEMTVNKAIIEAGYRKPRIKMIVDPESVAKILKVKFNPVQIDELIRLLLE